MCVWGGGGGGGGEGGSNCLFPKETHITCDFPGGFRHPVPPLAPRMQWVLNGRVYHIAPKYSNKCLIKTCKPRYSLPLSEQSVQSIICLPFKLHFPCQIRLLIILNGLDEILG